jgi:4-hydroxy-2-oxoheptanedioate aldolase
MNKVKNRWSQGLPACGSWMNIASPLVAETLSRAGYDCVVVDVQHAETNINAIAPMLTAIELGGAEPFVRLRWNRPEDIMYALDMGAYGVIVPLVESAAHARAMVDAALYPPHGSRSYGPRRPALRYGESYARQARDTFVLLAMIETRRGLDHLDEILTVDGLDGVFIGPADLSQSLVGVPRADSDDPVVVAAVAHILTAAKAYEKRAGIFCAGAEFGAQKIREGFDFVTLTPDIALIDKGARAALATARAAH